MPHIRILAAAAATAVALAFALTPAAARPCDDGNESCAEVAKRTAPMKLDGFMKTWKPAAVSKQKQSAVSKQKQSKKRKAAPPPAAEPSVAESAPAEITPSAPVNMLAAAPEKTIETDGIAITSFHEVNEIDAAADQVQVVAFNEVNDIDLAAPPAPVARYETTGQSVASPEQTPADNSWIGKLLLAVAGTIAVAGTARMLIA